MHIMSSTWKFAAPSEDFLPWAETGSFGKTSTMMFIEKFAELDEGGTGTLPKDEVAAVLKILNIDKADELLATAAVKDGRISYVEFLAELFVTDRDPIKD